MLKRNITDCEENKQLMGIIKLRYGNTNTFFIRGNNANLLIDTDYAGTLSYFYKEIKRNNISVKDITYLLETHFHPDHIGLVSELMDLGVKLLLIDVQIPFVHFSDEIFGRDKRLKYEPVNESEAVVITCEQSREFLNEVGICGEIISTPSHSQDSISVVLDDGICIVGDLEPMEYLEAYENNSDLKRDWDLILSRNPRKIYYSHANEKIF